MKVDFELFETFELLLLVVMMNAAGSFCSLD